MDHSPQFRQHPRQGSLAKVDPGGLGGEQAQMSKEVLGPGLTFLWVSLPPSRAEETEAPGTCSVATGSTGGLQPGLPGSTPGRRQLQKQKAGMRGCPACTLYGLAVSESRVHSRNHGPQPPL